MKSKHVDRIFWSAAQIASTVERDAYLQRACGDDLSLRQRVEQLLQARSNAEDFFQSSAVAPFARFDTERPITESPGMMIGPYKLLEQIGEGGFGVVFMAEQTAPVRRKAAVKVIKPGMDTRQVIARFEAERQALAMMDHPNIARVLDAGATDTGRPYFVMELVRGIPVTEYCDQRQLSLAERLELFVTVCQAVQHAHQKGVIHRDIKPTNVLITLYDDKPIVKVIDFGVAKATVGQLTDETLFTGFSQMIGTPLYMSPEQAALSGLDVDTRSDVYSLGVLFYELLTGTTPFHKSRLKEAAFDEIRRIICNEEPPKPSSRLSSLGEDALSSISAQRLIEPRKLRQLLRGDLDWIAMKALEKDRSRRYESASALARDVERHLHNEPVQACPPSKWYRLRKLAARNRGLFLGATAAVLVVLFGMAALAVSNMLIRKEQARTSEEKDRAERALQLAEDRAGETRQSLEDLKAANAWLERGRRYASLHQWDDAHSAFTKAVELRPEHAAAWVERGELFAQLGLWDQASADFAQEFEHRDPETTMRWYRLALLRLSLDDVEGYRQIRDRMRDRFRGTLDDFFASEILRTSALGSEPDEDLPPLVELAEHYGEGEPHWYRQYVVGLIQYRAGNYEQAVLQLEAALTPPPDFSGRALGYPVLAMARYRLGLNDEARQALQAAAETIDYWTQERYGRVDSNGWVIHQGAIASWPVIWWDWLEFRLLYREAKLLIDGSAPVDDARLHVLRARALAGLRRNFTADLEYAVALQLKPDDPQIRLEAFRCAGYSAIGRQDWDAAAANFSSASELTPDDSNLWRFRAVALLGAGDLDGYRQTCAAMLERFETTVDVLTAAHVVSACIARDDALPDMVRLLPLAQTARATFGAGPTRMGAVLYRAGHYEEAVQTFEASMRRYRPSAAEWSFLAMAYHRLGRADQARRCLNEASAWIETANRRTEGDLSSMREGWGSWIEPVLFPLLYREAEALIFQGDGRHHPAASSSVPIQDAASPEEGI